MKINAMFAGIALTGALALAACSGGAGTDETGETATTTETGPTFPEVAEAAPYDGPIPMPIKVGSAGPEMDACGSTGTVANLDPAGDNYLSVRDAPSTSTKERDRLDAGQAVTVCGESNGWLGVVYSEEGEDCGVSSPVATEENYTGPCAQGWVDGRFVEIIAG